MQKLLLTTAAVAAFSGAAYAQETTTGPVLSGEVELTFGENAAGDYAGAMDLELGINAGGLATVDLDFGAKDGGSVTLDNWTVGTNLGAIDIAIGDDNGLFPGAEGEHTLTEPTMTESIVVSGAGASIAVGFTDWTKDVTDVSNIQGAYTVDASIATITAAGDYNIDSENFVIGGAIGGINVGPAGLGAAVTYDVDAEATGYEVMADAFGITTYVNGNNTDAMQNVGGEYVYDLGGAALTAGANYDVNKEEFSPSASIAFSF